MPKVELREKKALMKKIQKVFKLIDRKISSEEVDRILNDPERDRIHELGEKIAETREAQNFFREEHYPEYQDLGFTRILPLYLDMSGTSEADKKNRELLDSLKTDEGKKKFARKAASEILSMDMKSLQPTGNVKKDIDFYVKHAREIELCWAVEDLVNHGKNYLNPEVYRFLEDRKPILQVAGQYTTQVKLAAHDYYTVMPEITPEERKQMENHDEMAATGVDDLFVTEFDDYTSNLQVQQDYQKDKMGMVMKKAIEMEKEGELTPFTIAENEKGERVKLVDGIDASLKGEKITFKENTEDKNIIAGYINKASHPIQMPKKNTSNYDAFSAEALSAQGKGLLEEYARLNKIMDEAKLWYTGGSFEFKETARLMKEFASGEIPNKDQAIEQLDQILKQCNKYIEDKEKENKELKPREQKRLDAMTAVRNSLKSKKDFLTTTVRLGDARHWEAENGAGDKTTPYHISTENQQFYHVAESDRKAGLYRKEIESYKGKDGALGKLASDVEETIKRLSDDSISDKIGGEGLENMKRPELVKANNRADLAKEIAKVALLEIMHEDRVAAKKNSIEALKGRTEVMLDDLAKKQKTWEQTILKISETETVKKLTEEIIKSYKATAEFFTNRGPQKLAADLKKEMRVLADNFENKEQNKEKKAEKKVENKKEKKAEADKKIQKGVLGK